MTKDEALRLAMHTMESVLANHRGAPVLPWIETYITIKAALETPPENYIYGTPLLDAMNGRSHTPKDVKKIMEPWSPVSIGVDVTKDGAHVVGIYALDADTSQIFYAKHHPAPQRTWVGLTDEEIDGMVEITDLSGAYYYDDLFALARAVEAKLKEKNT
jgi:hypothetical protein